VQFIMVASSLRLVASDSTGYQAVIGQIVRQVERYSSVVFLVSGSGTLQLPMRYCHRTRSVTGTQLVLDAGLLTR
jgi:hypothetical protein